jgi:hypothetical protein
MMAKGLQMTDFDPTKAHVTLADGKVIQVLDEDGEFDDAATAAAVDDYLSGATNGS